MSLKIENNLVSLTDIWKAGGEQRNHLTTVWRSCGGQKIIDSVKSRSDEEVWVSKRGFNGYTLATWEIAFAYARWISHQIHLDVVREWLILNGGDESLMAFAIPEILELTEAGKDLMILTQMKGE